MNLCYYNNNDDMVEKIFSVKGFFCGFFQKYFFELVVWVIEGWIGSVVKDANVVWSFSI